MYFLTLVRNHILILGDLPLSSHKQFPAIDLFKRLPPTPDKPSSQLHIFQEVSLENVGTINISTVAIRRMDDSAPAIAGVNGRLPIHAEWAIPSQLKL
ncbi:unnamed protein product [Penicillium camemberti]|uniref:Str. FM013 n=1 Tax=Penicillium camemberti (strain FM 013) TaxID=1429867 RepID=A0A0G4P138_PENC3|nr:unnamed protein product [Penicillium camemberti]